MDGQVSAYPEGRLFDALREVFEIEQVAALDISMQVVCQIASYVADVGALSRHDKGIDIALARIDEIQVELSLLSSHLREFQDHADPRLIN